MWSDYLERPLVDLDCRNAVFSKQGEVAILKRFPTDLNRGDSQRNVDERVFAH